MTVSPILMWHCELGRTARLYPQLQSYLICFLFLSRKQRDGSSCRSACVTILSNLPLSWKYYFGLLLWSFTICELDKVSEVSEVSKDSFVLKVSNFKLSQTLTLCKVNKNGQSVINTVSSINHTTASSFMAFVHIDAGWGKGRKNNIVVEY